MGRERGPGAPRRRVATDLERARTHRLETSASHALWAGWAFCPIVPGSRNPRPGTSSFSFSGSARDPRCVACAIGAHFNEPIERCRDAADLGGCDLLSERACVLIGHRDEASLRLFLSPVASESRPTSGRKKNRKKTTTRRGFNDATTAMAEKRTRADATVLHASRATC